MLVVVMPGKYRPEHERNKFFLEVECLNQLTGTKEPAENFYKTPCL
jgi:hypothetical protein